jgi:hypothetical protein
MPPTAQVVLPVVLRGRQVVLFEPLRLTKRLVLSSGRRVPKPAFIKGGESRATPTFWLVSRTRTPTARDMA